MEISDLARTVVAWHRFGKEHGEDEFRLNEPQVVEEYVRDKVQRFKDTADDNWKWFQLSDDLIIEQPFDGRPQSGPDSTIYYLPNRMWCIQENMHGEDWTWYVHIGKTEYNSNHQAWVFKDLFVDVIIKSDMKTHTILDLDDLADVFEMGLVDDSEVTEILRSTQTLVDQIRSSDFPPTELANREKFKSTLGW